MLASVRTFVVAGVTCEELRAHGHENTIGRAQESGISRHDVVQPKSEQHVSCQELEGIPEEQLQRHKLIRGHPRSHLRQKTRCRLPMEQ